jgi:hypothetical protein
MPISPGSARSWRETASCPAAWPTGATAHIGTLLERWPGTTVSVVASQYAGGGLLQDLLHNESLVLLRERLMLGYGTAVITVPYRIVSDRRGLPAQPEAPPTPGPEAQRRGG